MNSARALVYCTSSLVYESLWEWVTDETRRSEEGGRVTLRGDRLEMLVVSVENGRIHDELD